MNPSVTISIPMHDAVDTIRRAVDSVLAQTHAELVLVVVNDGGPASVWEPLADIDDARLVRFDVGCNIGRYAVDHLVATTCKTPWWAPFDADDWAEPGWLAGLLDVAADDGGPDAPDGVDVVLAPQVVHPLRGEPKVEQVKRWDGSRRFTWHAHMAGLWSTAWVRKVHATNPALRVGWDTVMTSLPFAAGTVGIAEDALYHRVRRPGSLTTADDTGMKSQMRREAVEGLRPLWKAIVDAPDRCAELIAAAYPIVDLPTPTAAGGTIVWSERETGCSATIPLGTIQAAPARVAGPRFSASDMQRRTELWGGWSLHPGAAAEIDGRIHQLAPEVVVEFGSGSSTLVLGRYAKATGARLVTLEHDERYLARTRDLLRRHRLDAHVELRHAPLVDTPTGPVYDTDLPDGIGFALVDGPPLATGGRAAALDELWPHLAPGWELWLDDGNRDSEQAALAAWRDDHGVTVEALALPKGLTRVTDRPVERTPMYAGDVTLTLLTGARPAHLAATLASLPEGLVETAHLVVLHNGGDDATGEVLDRYREVIDDLVVTEELLPIGAACTLLADRLRTPLWLHLEDDWLAATTVDGWLAVARDALDDLEVAQVRLRHRSDRVLGRHMVTRRQIRWDQHPAGRVALAHLSTNPTLTRSVDAPKMWPAEGERAMQRRAHAAGMDRVVQLHPGVFVHTGDASSLRKETRCPA